MLCALNRSHELRLHIRGAINTEISESELADIFLQVGIYFGIPASIEAFRIGKEVIAEMEEERWA